MSRNASLAIAFILIFSFYAYHAAPGVTVEDSGDFQMAAQTLGIAHPPGYPLYTMATYVATKVPGVSPAFSVNLLSAFFGGLSLVLFWLILARVFSEVSPWIRGMVTASAGLHPIFWSQCGIAEVYSLNTFLILWIYGLAVEAFGGVFKQHKIFLISLGLGLGLSHHYPLFILAVAPLVAWMARSSWGRFLDRNLIRSLGGGLLLGLTPYFYLVVQAIWGNPEYNFGKLSNLSMVWEHILRFHYRGIDDVGGVLADRFLVLFRVEAEILKGYFLMSPFILIGLWRFEAEKWKWRWILHGGLLTTTLVLALSLGFVDNDRYRAIFKAYMSPALFFHAAYLLKGVYFISKWMWSRWSYAWVRPLGQIFSGLVILAQGAWSYPSASHRHDQFVSLWAKDLLESLDPKASLILCGTDVLAVYYTHLVEGVRPDLTLYDQFSLFTQKNLYGSKLLFQTPDPLFVRRNFELQKIKDGSSSIYYLCEESIKELSVPFERTLYAFKVTSNTSSVPRQAVQINDELWQAAVSGLPHQEYWLDKRRANFFYHALSFAVVSQKDLITPMMGYIKRSRLIRNHEFLLALAKLLTDGQEHKPTLQLLRSKEEQYGRQHLHAEELSLYCGLELLQGKESEAETLCLLALAKRDQSSCLGPAHINLALIYRNQGNQEKQQFHAKSALKCDPDDRRAKALLIQ